jgi:hypothetical protein
MSRAAQARGHVKTVARPLVEMHYNLGAANGNRKNRDNVENLCQRIAYAYKVCDWLTGNHNLLIIMTRILLSVLDFTDTQLSKLLSTKLGFATKQMMEFFSPNFLMPVVGFHSP